MKSFKVQVFPFQDCGILAGIKLDVALECIINEILEPNFDSYSKIRTNLGLFFNMW